MKLKRWFFAPVVLAMAVVPANDDPPPLPATLTKNAENIHALPEVPKIGMTSLQYLAANIQEIIRKSKWLEIKYKEIFL